VLVVASRGDRLSICVLSVAMLSEVRFGETPKPARETRALPRVSLAQLL